MGSLFFFFLEDWAVVHEFRHNAGIKDIVPEPNGTKVSLLLMFLMSVTDLILILVSADSYGCQGMWIHLQSDQR